MADKGEPIRMTDADEDWLRIKSWALPTDLTRFMEFARKQAPRSGPKLRNDELAKWLVRFQQTPTSGNMPVALRDEVDALIRSGTYGSME